MFKQYTAMVNDEDSIKNLRGLMDFNYPKKGVPIEEVHTTAIQILPIGTFFTQIKPIAMTTVTIPIILHFVPIVMALF